jgi:hypothetical protein
MFGVDKIGEIRRAYFEQERSIKEIVRGFSVSRATVRKIIRGRRTEFKYARDVQPSPKLGVWVEALTEILESESKLAKRERRSTQRLFEELRGRGYGGAHDSVHRFAKFWREERSRVPTHAYVPMSFAPGEAYQFDWIPGSLDLGERSATWRPAVDRSKPKRHRRYWRRSSDRRKTPSSYRTRTATFRPPWERRPGPRASPLGGARRRCRAALHDRGVARHRS